jgi:hypothetical protein
LINLLILSETPNVGSNNNSNLFASVLPVATLASGEELSTLRPEGGFINLNVLKVHSDLAECDDEYQRGWAGAYGVAPP